MKLLGIILFVFFSIYGVAQPPEFLNSKNWVDPIWIVDDVIISQKRFQKADSLKVKENIEKINVYKSGDETKSVFGSPVETGILQLITKKSILKTKPINRQQLNKKYKLEADSPIYVNGYLMNKDFSIDKESIYATDLQKVSYDNQTRFVLNLLLEKPTRNATVSGCFFGKALKQLSTETIQFSKEDLGKYFYVCNADEGNYYLRVTLPKFEFITDTLSQDEVATLNSEIKYKNLDWGNHLDTDYLNCLNGNGFEIFCLREEKRESSFNVISTQNDSFIVKREVLVQELLIERLESENTPQITDGQILKKVGQNPLPKVIPSDSLPSGGSQFIKEIQTLLNEKGYNVEVTNTLTEETKEAINTYCKEHGLEENILSIDFVRSLGYEKPNCICKQVEE